VRPAALIFDLDETLLADHASTDATLAALVDDAYLDGRDMRLEACTLADSLRRHARRVWATGPERAYVDAIGIGATEALWGSFAGDDPHLRRMVAWAPEYHRAVWFEALAECGIADEALARWLAARFREERRARHLLFPDTLPALERLRTDYRLAMLTNGAPDIQRAKIDGSGLAASFAVIVVSGEVGAGKPDPRIYAHTLALLGIPASQAVMIGDNLTNDVYGAQAAGMRGIWLDRRGGDMSLGPRPTGEHRRPCPRPDATIPSLAELPNTLLAM
jgi:putative hydrolase of the HAD superfamily